MTDAAASSTLSQQVQLAVRPGEAVSLLGVCVACGNAATELMPVSRRQGQVTRSLEVPVCAECARQAGRRSGREEQLSRLRWLAIGATAVGLFGLVWLLTGGLYIVLWRIAIGLGAAGLGVALLWWAFDRAIRAAELPERRVVREAVQITDFSERKMTLVFARGAYAVSVAELNQINQTDEPVPAAILNE